MQFLVLISWQILPKCFSTPLSKQFLSKAVLVVRVIIGLSSVDCVKQVMLQFIWKTTQILLFTHISGYTIYTYSDTKHFRLFTVIPTMTLKNLNIPIITQLIQQLCKRTYNRPGLEDGQNSYKDEYDIVIRLQLILPSF